MWMTLNQAEAMLTGTHIVKDHCMTTGTFAVVFIFLCLSIHFHTFRFIQVCQLYPGKSGSIENIYMTGDWLTHIDVQQLHIYTWVECSSWK